MAGSQTFFGVVIAIAVDALSLSSTEAAADANSFGNQQVGDPFQSCAGQSSDAEHNAAVEQRINKYIQQVNQQFPEMTQAEKLKQAWGMNILDREENPTDSVGRDADYYFAARHIVADSDNNAEKAAKTAAGPVAWALYAIGKLGSMALGHPEWARADKDKPNAPIGGLTFMNSGSSDAFNDKGNEVGPINAFNSDKPPPPPPPPSPPPPEKSEQKEDLIYDPSKSKKEGPMLLD